MGFSYAVDMINRMKQERSRNTHDKKRGKFIKKAITLDNKISNKYHFKKVSPQKLESIKQDIRKKAFLERRRRDVLTVIVYFIVLTSFIVLYFNV